MAYRLDFIEDEGRRMFLGTDMVLLFPVYDMTNKTQTELDAEIAAGTATPVDVALWSFRFSIKRRAITDDPGVIDKETGSGITIIGTYDPDQATNTQRVRVAIADTDSYDPDVSPVVDLSKGKYDYALKRSDAGSETIIAFGKFQFQQATTHE